MANAVRVSGGADEAGVKCENDRLPTSPRMREARAIEACESVIDLTAAFFNLPGRELRRPDRCTGEIARVRQIAMYVCHVVLGITMADVGQAFGRDRTTVVHACHLIEDLRDDVDFDQIIGRTEHIVAAAFRGRLPL